MFQLGGSGLQDPCEKGLVDASACLSAQERVNITLSAQVRGHVTLPTGYAVNKAVSLLACSEADSIWEDSFGSGSRSPPPSWFPEGAPRGRQD